MRWRTMIPEEVFLFVAPKSRFLFSECKKGRFCEATTKWLIQNTTVTFFKYTRPPYMDNFITGGSQIFLSILGEKDNIPAELAGSGSDMNYSYMIRCSYFLQKSFLGSKYFV